MNSWAPGGVRTNMKLVRGRSGDALVAGLEDEELREAFETGVSPREVAELPGPGPRPGDRPGSASCSWWLLHRSRGVDDPGVLVGLGQRVPRARHTRLGGAGPGRWSGSSERGERRLRGDADRVGASATVPAFRTSCLSTTTMSVIFRSRLQQMSEVVFISARTGIGHRCRLPNCTRRGCHCPAWD